MPKFLNVTVRSEGRSAELFLKTIEKKFTKEVLRRDLDKVAKEVLNATEKYIDAHRQRGIETHSERWRTATKRNLISTLRAATWIDKLGNNRFRLGIGNKAFLTRHAKYWYLVNYGGKINMKGKQFIPGFFDKGFPPMGGRGKQVFHYSGRMKRGNPFIKLKNGNFGYSFPMIPTAPIPPMRYLAFMGTFFTRKMNDLAFMYRQKLRERQR